MQKEEPRGFFPAVVVCQQAAARTHVHGSKCHHSRASQETSVKLVFELICFLLFHLVNKDKKVSNLGLVQGAGGGGGVGTEVH